MKNKLLKIIKPFLMRPLLAVFILVILITIPKNKIHSERMYDKYEEGADIYLQGKVRAIDYHPDGRVKSITVGDVLCYVNSYSNVSLHDYVNLQGSVKQFAPPMNYGSFDVRKYYACLGVFCYVNSPVISITKEASCLSNKMLTLRLKAAERINEYCQFEAGTICTLVLGDKRFLNEVRKDLYQSAGVAHFLVISGLHISALGALIYKLLGRLLKKKLPAIVITISFLVLYGITVGFSVSVIRAVIMYSVRLISYLFKETYDMISAICLAGTLTLIISPQSLTSSAFIYSYATVFIIGIYIEFLSEVKDKKSPLKKRLLVNIKLPVFLSLCIAPVSLYLSYSYQPLSFLVNLILMPFSGPILILAMLAFIFSMIGIAPLALLLDYLLTIVLRLLDLLCKLVSHVPDSIILGKPDLWELLLYYFLLAFGIYLVRKKPFSKLMLIPYVSILALILLAPSFYTPKLSMLYVGQGECVVVRTGHNRAVIFDCGSSSEKEIAKYTVIPFLKASGINRIDALYASHSDIDHISGYEELIEEAGSNGIKLCKLFIPGTHLFMDEAGTSLISKAKENDLPVYALSQGDTVLSGLASISCLWPLGTDTISDDSNAYSMVSLLSLHNTRILITGDITEETECTLINTFSSQYLSSVNILKVAHHGSKTATSDAFLKAVTPEIAIISAGINNRYHHPSSEVIKRLIEAHIPYYVTSLEGQVDISLITLQKSDP